MNITLYFICLYREVMTRYCEPHSDGQYWWSAQQDQESSRRPTSVYVCEGEVGRITLNVGSPVGWGLGANEKRTWTVHQFFFPSWYLWRGQLPQAPAAMPSLPWWTLRLNCEREQTSPPFSFCCQVFCYNTEQSNWHAHLWSLGY